VTPFDPYRLTLARWAAGVTKSELARKLGMSPASVSQYEAGNTRPSPQVVAQIALVLGVQPAYFWRSPDRRRPSPATRSFFRSLRSTRQWERDQADALSEHAYDIASFLERRITLPTADIPSLPVGAAATRSEIEEIASRVRADWDVAHGRPVANVVRLIESRGVVVCRLPAASDRVDAFSRWFETRPLVVLLDGKSDKARSRFDVAHELAHLVMHHEPEFSDRLQERQAHAFAAALLMPAGAVADDLPRRTPRGPDWDHLKEAQRRWGVSIAALLYRARELGALPESGFRRAMTRYNQLGLRHHDGEALGTPEQPRLLAEAVAALLEHKGWTHEQLAEELLFTPRQLEQVLGPDPGSTAPDSSTGHVIPLRRSTA
jgi:Zn-dependent peptidase ImmA (M78 family)/transcriptional regulator with XRE-family HTH domain